MEELLLKEEDASLFEVDCLILTWPISLTRISAMQQEDNFPDHYHKIFDNGKDLEHSQHIEQAQHDGSKETATHLSCKEPNSCSSDQCSERGAELNTHPTDHVLITTNDDGEEEFLLDLDRNDGEEPDKVGNDHDCGFMIQLSCSARSKDHRRRSWSLQFTLQTTNYAGNL